VKHRSLRTNILAAMGLAACAPEPLSSAELADPAMLERLSVDRTSPLTLEVDDVAWQSDRLGVFTVTGAEPGALVWVMHAASTAPLCLPRWGGECLELAWGAGVLDVVTADAAGEAVLMEPIPDYTDGGTLVFQAGSVGPGDVLKYSPPTPGVASNPTRGCGEFPEVDPDQFVYSAFTVRYVCTDTPLNLLGVPTAQAETVFAQALGLTSLAGNWLVTASCLEPTFTDRSCYTMWLRSDTGYGGGIGRPFEVAGQWRAAAAASVAGWSTPAAAGDVPEALRGRLAAYWTELGRAEHASVASFSRFNLELLALGAPAELLAASTRALGDEIRHAQLAWGLAAAWHGHPVGPGPLDPTGALDRSTDPAAVLVAAIVEGCVGETVSAAQARAAADGARDPALRATLTVIADDEARHAELSWAFVRWMLDRYPELRPLAARTFAGWSVGPKPDPDADADALLAFGMMTPALNHRVARDVARVVVAPCAAALLATASASAA
jgi:hypothetical protein